LCVVASKVYEAVSDPVASVNVFGEVVRRWPPRDMD
jgi:hypothetical protein